MTVDLTHRLIAFDILKTVLDRRQPLDDTFARLTRNIEDPRHRAFIRALVGATLRHKGEIDAIIDACLRHPLADSTKDVRHALALGLAQALHMETADHASVATTVDIARAKGFARQSGLVNAILRRVLRNPAAFADLHDTPSLPSWILESWTAHYGAETVRDIARQQQPEPPLDLSLRNPAEAPLWAERLNGHLLPTGSLRCRPSGAIETMPGFTEGAWWVQDAAAALPARLLGNVNGLRIADLCAAPGGKTLQLAVQGAHVTAVDRSTTRLKRLHDNLQRTQLAGQVDVIAADVANWKTATPFDAILLDAPCTATGTMRRHPDVAWTKTPQDVESLATTQKAIITDIARLLKPGGIMVYCVCSLEAAEETVSPRQPPANMVADPIKPEEIAGWEFALRADGAIRTLPCHLADDGGLDGFYIARFRKPTA